MNMSNKFSFRAISFSVLTGVFMTVSLQASASAKLLDRVAVIINDDVIMKSQVEQRFDAVLKNVKRKNAKAPNSDEIVKQVVEQLILENIQMQIAERAGVRIDDNTLNKTMERIAKKNNMTLSEFQETLIKEGSSYQDAREQVRREMITTRVREGSVGRRIKVTNQEILNYLESTTGQEQMQAAYHIGHILIKVPEGTTDEEKRTYEEEANKLSKQLRQGANFSEYAATYSSGPNAAKGGDMGWRKADKLPSLFAAFAPDLQKGDVSKPIVSGNGFHIIKMFDRRGGEHVMMSQTRVRHILIKANELRDEEQTKNFVSELRAQITNGESFADLAQAHSVDTGTINSGGDLGWMNPADLVPKFREVMESSELNIVSEPFRSRFGWHVLEVLERREQDMGEEVMKRQAKNVIYQRKFEEELQLWLREQRENAFVDIKLY